MVLVRSYHGNRALFACALECTRAQGGLWFSLFAFCSVDRKFLLRRHFLLGHLHRKSCKFESLHDERECELVQEGWKFTHPISTLRSRACKID